MKLLLSPLSHTWDEGPGERAGSGWSPSPNPLPPISGEGESEARSRWGCFSPLPHLGRGVGGEGKLKPTPPQSLNLVTPSSNHRIRNTSKELQSAAQHLRKNPTEAEAVLWQALRAEKLDGFKFRRQHPIGRFIADFYCSQCKLIIEVDGDIHDEQKEQDAARTAEIEKFGVRVIRFSNDEVLENLTAVIEKIRQALTV